MKKTKLILSSSILSTIALAPIALGSCATITKLVNKNASTINSVTVGSFKYDLDTEKKTATVVGPDTTVESPNYNTIPATISYSSDDYTVTAIADNAFDSFTKFTKGTVSIGSNVKTIGKYAFYRCKNITGISLNSVLTDIGDYAFKKCTNLTGNCTIPATVKTIGVGAFEETAIQYVNSTGTFDNLTSIGACAFKNCTSLVTIGSFSSKLTSIGASAFYGCSALTGTSTTALTIPTSVTNIGALAFKGCTGLYDKGIAFADQVYWSRNGSGEDTSPMKPSSSDTKTNYNNLVNETGAYWNNNLTKYVPVTSITVRVKNYPVSGMYSLYDEDDAELIVEPENATCKTFIYDSTIKINTYTGHFVCNEDDTNFTIKATAQDGSGVSGTSISYAVGACPVESVAFTSVPSKAFKNSPVTLTASATLRESVTDPQAIEQYSKLKYSIIEGSSYATIDESTGVLTPTANGTIKVKAQSSEFSGRFAIAEIEIGSTLNITNGVLNGFDELALSQQGESQTSGPIYTEFGDTLKIPAEVTSIASEAFINPAWGQAKKLPICIKYIDFTAATQLTSIGSKAFYDAYSLIYGTLTLPASVKTIGDSAFENWQNITTFDLSGCTSLEKIGNSSFDGALKCTSILLPQNAPNFTEIGNYAFHNLRAITTITLPASLTKFGTYVFLATNALTSIVFTDYSARWVNNNVKYSVVDPTTNATVIKDKQANVWTKGSVTTDGITINTTYGYGIVYTESGKTFTTVELPAAAKKSDGTWCSVTMVGYNAFAYQSSLTTVYIPETIAYFRSNAFEKCTSLSSIDFPDSTYIIDEDAFSGCTSLTSIDLSSTDVDMLRSNCFDGCTGVTSIKMPTATNQFKEFDSNCLTGVGTAAGKCELEIQSFYEDPWSSTRIEDGAFSGAMITSLVLGANASYFWEKVTTNAGDLFTNCAAIYLPEGTTIQSSSSYIANNYTKQSSSSKAGYDYYKKNA